MLIIKELKKNREIYFQAIFKDENNKVIFTDKIYFKSVIKEINNITYLMLYDRDMQPISDVFNFLNFNTDYQSINSSIKALQALKLLYCFQYIINKELVDFNYSDFNDLKLFLKGYTPLKGTSLTLELMTVRSDETVNGYLSIYRKYLEFLGKFNEILFKKSNRKTLITLPDSEIDYSVSRFKINEKIPKKPVEVPRYISVEEFKTIINEIRKNYSIREEIIVRLMFQCGLRIGECLGITADDLVVEEIEGSYITTLYIRNRLSDKDYQHAKTCMKISNKKQYSSKEYNLKGYGYYHIVIPEDLFDLINEYIEEYHLKARENKKDNYYNNTIADRVRKAEPYEDDNYYVFINSLGRPLSQALWNITIKEIFVKCDIKLDTKVKQNNLNHRFRHGFAMFNVKYLHCTPLELQKRLRHKSLKSVSCYYKPTIPDQIELKTAFTESLYDILPDLRKE